MTTTRFAAGALLLALGACGQPAVPAANVDGAIKSVDVAGHKVVLDDGKRGASVTLPATIDMAQFTVGTRARLEHSPNPGGDVTIAVYPAPVKETANVVDINTATHIVTLSDGTKMPVPKPSDMAFMRIGMPITIDKTPKPFTAVVVKGTGTVPTPGVRPAAK